MRHYTRYILTLASIFVGTINTANADPLSSEHLSPELLKGENLFRNVGGYGCKVCHGLYAHDEKQAGGNIRGATEQALIESLSKQPSMQLLTQELSPADIRSLANYLQFLGKTPLVRLHFTNNQWHVKAEKFNPNDRVQIVLFNESFSPQTLNLSSIELGEIKLGALETTGIMWVP